MTQSLVVVVTGSSAGLGRAIAHGFAKRGARIGLIARNPEALQAAKEECESLGGHAMVLPVDVSDADAVDAAASKVEEAFGPIDVWVNDAMVSVFSPVKGDGGGGLQARHGCSLSGFRTRHAVRTETDAAPRSRHDHPDWLRSFVSIDSTAIGLLRLQTCHQWLHRLVALRAASRQQ